MKTEDSNNPYAAPAHVADASALNSVDSEGRELLAKYRKQIHALGGVWILFCFLSVGLGILVMGGMLSGADADQEVKDRVVMLAIIMIGIGAVWGVVGVMSCMKQMWAVYLGLALSYLSLISSVLGLKIVGIAIMAFVVMQGHRVIGFANKLKAADIPLNHKP